MIWIHWRDRYYPDFDHYAASVRVDIAQDFERQAQVSHYTQETRSPLWLFDPECTMVPDLVEMIAQALATTACQYVYRKEQLYGHRKTHRRRRASSQKLSRTK